MTYNVMDTLISTGTRRQTPEVEKVLSSSGGLTNQTFNGGQNNFSQEEIKLKNTMLKDGYGEEDFLKVVKNARGQMNRLKELPQADNHGNILNRFGQGIKLKSNADDNIFESAGKFGVNIFGDGIQLVGEVADIFMHPIDFATNVYDLGYGVTDSLLNKIGMDLPGEDRANMARLLGNQIKENFTDMDKFKKMIVENPVDTILTLVPGINVAKGVAKSNGLVKVAKALDVIEKGMMMPIKAEFGLAKKVVTAPIKAIKPVTEFGLSQATGLNVPTLRSIVKNPKLFEQSKTGLISRESLGKELFNTFDKLELNIKKELGEYKTTRDFPASVKFGNFLEDSLTKKGLIFEDGKVIDPKNKFTGTELNKIQKFVDETKASLNRNGGDYMDIETFLNTRQKANKELAKFDTGVVSDKLKSLGQGLYKDINKEFRTQIPGLEKLDKKFAKDIGFFNDIKKDYFTKQGQPRDNFFSLLENLTNKGKEFKLERLKQVIPNIEEKINSLKAFEDVSNAMGQKVGTYARAGFTGVVTGNPLIAVAQAILLNPKVASSILQGIGYSKEFVANIFTKIKLGKKLDKQEKVAIIEGAKSELADDLKKVDYTADDLKDFAKDIEGQIKGAGKEELLDMREGIKTGYDIPEVNKNYLIQKIDNEIKNFDNLEIDNPFGTEAFSLAEHYGDDLTKAFNQLEGIQKRTKSTKGGDKMTKIEFETSPAYKSFSDKAQEFLGENLDDLSVQEVFEQMQDMKGGVKFQILGEKAKSSDLGKLDKAKKMQKDGIKANIIWEKTGWEKGTDGKWKFEIDDSNAKLHIKNIDDFNNKMMDNIDNNIHQMELKDILEHDELYKNYPELKSINIEMLGKRNDGTIGYFDTGLNTIFIDFKRSPEKIKSSILHELQHNIQEIENFGKGGSINSIKTIEEKIKLQDSAKKEYQKLVNSKEYIELGNKLDNGEITAKDFIDNKLSKKADKLLLDMIVDEKEIYKRFSGEVEARNVQSRIQLKDKEKNRPGNTEDVERDRQINKFQKTELSGQGAEITQKQAKEVVEKYFKPEKVGVEFVEKITTPEGLEALGKYRDKLITFSKRPLESTPEHEVLHAFFDTMVSDKTKKAVLEEIKETKHFADDLNAEEWLADNFVEFVRKREVSGLKAKTKQFFQDMLKGLKDIFFDGDKIDNLYRDLERLEKGDKRNIGKLGIVAGEISNNQEEK